MKDLLTAIVEDGHRAVEALFKAEGGLFARLIRRTKFYDSRIFHWIYVGDNALHLAAAGYRVEIVRLLLAACADPNAAANHRRCSPLHYAADGFISGPAWDAKRQVETIGCLLNKGANIHSQDKNGATPLHRAVRTRCAAAVRCLRRAGSDPTLNSLKSSSGSEAPHFGSERWASQRIERDGAACSGPGDAVSPEPMSQAPRILYCHCQYAQVVPPEVKAAVLKKLCESGVAFDAVADLCEMSARQDPSLQRLASGGVKIAACYPRAVKWLFHTAKADLPPDLTEVLNMRVQSAEEVCAALFDGGVKPNLPQGKVTASDTPKVIAATQPT